MSNSDSDQQSEIIIAVPVPVVDPDPDPDPFKVRNKKQVMHIEKLVIEEYNRLLKKGNVKNVPQFCGMPQLF